MKISHTWLQTYFKDTLPAAEKLAELFNIHAFEVEGVEKVETSNDTVLDIKVLPDRAHYALCHRGIAREVSVISKLSLNDSHIKLTPADAAIASLDVTVKDASFCQRYVARRIENVKVGESPTWLKERLETVGARSINSIVDTTNFVMFDIGQPMHAFDADKVKGKITIRAAVEGEKVTILDGREITLTTEDSVVSDEAGALDIAGIKGGKRAEVTRETQNIIIMAAHFNATRVRRTATRIGIKNDSSKRYENGITPALAGEGIEHTSALMLSLSPEAKAGPVTDMYSDPVLPWTVTVSVAHMSAIIGIPLWAQEVADMLRSEGCAVSVADDILTITPPLDRLDLIIPEDIADEIGRIRGYDSLPACETPFLVDNPPLNRMFFWAEKTKNILLSLGYSETLLYALVPKGAFEISYPLANDKAALRENISPKLIESLAMNARNADLLGLDTIKIFEIGRVFPKTGEKTSLCIGVVQVKKKKGITSESILKDTLVALESDLGVPLEAKIIVEQQAAFVEIDFDAVSFRLPAQEALKELGFNSLSKDIRYKPFSVYPFIVRDIALFAPASVSEEEVREVVERTLRTTADKLLVKGPDCFDRFEKESKKSLAFRMIFQSFERTLSDEEVNRFMEAVYEAVKTRGWEVR